MATSIPSIDYPAGMTPPTPSAGGSSGMPALPALPALPSLSQSDENAAADIAAGGTGTASDGGIGSAKSNAAGAQVLADSVWTNLGAWLKSIALSGTFALVALLLIVLSVYIAVTRHGGVVLPSK
jgi:hypothetical protein